MTPTETGPLRQTPGTYVWQIPGRPIAIHLSLNVVDGILQEVMRGFGAVPRRGAEVGGILLGSAQEGEGKLLVEIREFQLLKIEYKLGPSYLLSPADIENLQRVLAAHRESKLAPVGYFRSNTRESDGLTQDDLDLLTKFLPGPERVALIIRPYASKVSTGGFFFRENGVFQSGPSLLEFPFRRKELAPAEVRANPRETNPVRQQRPAPPPELPVVEPAAAGGSNVPRAELPPSSPLPLWLHLGWFRELAPPRRWLWVSIVLVLLGLLIGFGAASLLNSVNRSEAYSLSLTVTKSGDNLHVSWDRQASAIRTASRGVLTINDGAFTKMLPLDAGQLQNGSVVYRHNSSGVRFQLQVFPSSRDIITETAEWKE